MSTQLSLARAAVLERTTRPKARDRRRRPQPDASTVITRGKYEVRRGRLPAPGPIHPGRHPRQSCPKKVSPKNTSSSSVHHCAPLLRSARRRCARCVDTDFRVSLPSAPPAGAPHECASRLTPHRVVAPPARVSHPPRPSLFLFFHRLEGVDFHFFVGD